MRDFLTEIKKINADGIICELSKASIDMFQRQQYYRIYELLSTNFGFAKNVKVPLYAWNVQEIAYLAAKHSNDYRRGNNIPTMGMLINLYRCYENEHSIVDKLRSSTNNPTTPRFNRILRAVLGITAEQFQYENIGWIYEKFNRDYYILLASKNFEHRSLIDTNAIVGELLGLTADEYSMVLFMIFGLSRLNPIPLSWYGRSAASELPQIISKEDVEKVIAYYSCTYDELRKNSLGKQLLYAKPFIKTQRDKSYISCNMYLVAMLLGNGLYWLVRDYYRNQKQYFPNAFGLLFEDYIKALGSKYCDEAQWGIIPQGKAKGADFYFDIGSIRIIVEAKSALLQLSAKQQIPDLDAIDIFFLRTIEKSYEQLNRSFSQMATITTRSIFKVTLLYDDFSNTSIIEQSIPEIYTKDSYVYIMTIRELEILLYTHKHNTDKCNDLCSIIERNASGVENRKSIGAILEDAELSCNLHLTGEMDFFTILSDKLQDKFD